MYPTTPVNRRLHFSGAVLNEWLPQVAKNRPSENFTFGLYNIVWRVQMTRKEFEAFLKIQDLQLLICTVTNIQHKTNDQLYGADVVTKSYEVVTEGKPAKTIRTAVQNTIKRHFSANN